MGPKTCNLGFQKVDSNRKGNCQKMGGSNLGITRGTAGRPDTLGKKLAKQRKEACVNRNADQLGFPQEKRVKKKKTIAGGEVAGIAKRPP